MKVNDELERTDKSIERRNKDKSGGLSIWHAVGGITLLGLTAMIIAAIPDIKRYIRISTM